MLFASLVFSPFQISLCDSTGSDHQHDLPLLGKRHHAAHGGIHIGRLRPARHGAKFHGHVRCGVPPPDLNLMQAGFQTAWLRHRQDRGFRNGPLHVADLFHLLLRVRLAADGDGDLVPAELLSVYCHVEAQRHGKPDAPVIARPVTHLESRDLSVLTDVSKSDLIWSLLNFSPSTVTSKPSDMESQTLR